MTTAKSSPNTISIPLQIRVPCPHCWSTFSPDQALWIAEHPDLVGDARLGSDQAQRFLPTRFNLEGAAIDARGFACHRLACPNCHLPVPRAVFEMPAVFLSILGGPSCGKSYFLASMTWRLRRVLPKYFALGFSDADPQVNYRLQEYESLQFLNPNQDTLVAIEKTETHGDLYDTVLYGDHAVSYPRPFMFSVTPFGNHPNARSGQSVSRALCVYDNAGESFLPGADTATSPVTRHLPMSRALLFLFDPTQDMRFRKACRGLTDDPQMVERSARLERERPVRQDTILLEAAARIRRYAGVAHNVKHSRPLLVVVTKFDCWSPLLTAEPLASPWRASSSGMLHAMKLDMVERISRDLRALLWRLTPEVVSAAESFSQRVIYIPVSASGGSPEIDEQTGALGFRPKNIHPIWAEVPILYMMSCWMQGLIPYVKRGSDAPASPEAGATANHDPTAQEEPDATEPSAEEQGP